MLAPSAALEYDPRSMTPAMAEQLVDDAFIDIESHLKAWGFEQGAAPFPSPWNRRNRLGIPGPVYVGDDDDACGTGPAAAPNNIYLLGFEGEFLFRQPTSLFELRQVVEAAETNVFDQYGMDGNAYWTPQAVAAWWHDIQPVRQQLRQFVSQHDEPVRNGRSRRSGQVSSTQLESLDAETCRWLGYLDLHAEKYLRRYIAFLKTRRVPGANDRLPPLRGQDRKV